MNTQEQSEKSIEKQFQELLDRAKQLYPNIEEDIASYTDTVAYTDNLQDYLNLTMQTPYEISNNQILFM